MSAANHPPPSSPNRSNTNAGSTSALTPNLLSRLTGRKSWVRGLVVLGLVGVYAAARPAINERTGLNLPALKVDSSGQVVAAKADKPSVTAVSVTDTTKPTAPQSSAPKTTPSKSSPSKSSPTKTATEDSRPDKFSPSKTAPSKPSPSKSSPAKSEFSKPDASKAAVNKTTGPLADRMRGESGTKSSAATAEKADPSLKYGLLRDTGGERYVSPAGLLYTPGSAEGHRIEHVRRHTEDDPGRPGSHGVFDGGIEGALKTIDDAFLRAKQGTRTTKEEEDGRVIYTVDMGKRVGFVGGRDGGRKNKPMARRVALVLEGTRVITAYPK